MNLRRIAVPCALAVALGLASTAEAKLPTPAVTTIVPGVSVAGVKLGMKTAAAKKLWGPGSVCGPAATGPGGTQCTWSVTPNAQPDLSPKLTIVLIKGKVRVITVDGGTGGPAIKAFRTAEKIGVGSTQAALEKAYPGISTETNGLGSGPTVTYFSTKNGRVQSIQVGSPF